MSQHTRQPLVLEGLSVPPPYAAGSDTPQLFGGALGKACWVGTIAYEVHPVADAFQGRQRVDEELEQRPFLHVALGHGRCSAVGPQRPGEGCVMIRAGQEPIGHTEPGLSKLLFNGIGRAGIFGPDTTEDRFVCCCRKVGGHRQPNNAGPLGRLG
jgi:hypothetical protein